MEQPIVSVIVPCFNQANFVVETLTSIENQTYANWECIIVNDGSTDNSVVVIEEYIKDKPKFQLINQRNTGVAIARNNAIKLTKGEFILPLDADDLITENYLELAVLTFTEEPYCKIVYG